jgi:hypothetical protein
MKEQAMDTIVAVFKKEALEEGDIQLAISICQQANVFEFIVDKLAVVKIDHNKKHDFKPLLSYLSKTINQNNSGDQLALQLAIDANGLLVLGLKPKAENMEDLELKHLFGNKFLTPVNCKYDLKGSEYSIVTSDHLASMVKDFNIKLLPMGNKCFKSGLNAGFLTYNLDLMLNNDFELTPACVEGLKNIPLADSKERKNVIHELIQKHSNGSRLRRSMLQSANVTHNKTSHGKFVEGSNQQEAMKKVLFDNNFMEVIAEFLGKIPKYEQRSNKEDNTVIRSKQGLRRVS